MNAISACSWCNTRNKVTWHFNSSSSHSWWSDHWTLKYSWAMPSPQFLLVLGLQMGSLTRQTRQHPCTSFWRTLLMRTVSPRRMLSGFKMETPFSMLFLPYHLRLVRSVWRSLTTWLFTNHSSSARTATCQPLSNHRSANAEVHLKSTSSMVLLLGDHLTWACFSEMKTTSANLQNWCWRFGVNHRQLPDLQSAMRQCSLWRDEPIVWPHLKER